jgi:hypothetical protein
MAAAILMLRGRMSWDVDETALAAADLELAFAYLAQSSREDSVVKWADTQTGKAKEILFLVYYNNAKWSEADALLNTMSFNADLRRGMLVWFLKRRLVGEADATLWLAKNIHPEKISGGQDWESTIIGVMLGKGELGSLNDLSARVSKGDEGTGLMLFYLGTLQILEGDLEGGRAHLLRCVAETPGQSFESRTAKKELERVMHTIKQEK